MCVKKRFIFDFVYTNLGVYSPWANIQHTFSASDTIGGQMLKPSSSLRLPRDIGHKSSLISREMERRNAKKQKTVALPPPPSPPPEDDVLIASQQIE